MDDRTYAQMAEAAVESVSIPPHDMPQEVAEIYLAKAQVYATLAVAGKLDDVCVMLDHLYARLES
jgi:hypothetical protein